MEGFILSLRDEIAKVERLEPAIRSSWAVGKMMEACRSVEDWCRGTESVCRHQPFQDIPIPRIIKHLNVKGDAKSDILLRVNSNTYRARCH